LDNAELTKIGYTIDRYETLEERSEADQIVSECELTEYLQQRVNRCNLHFQLRLEMEEVGNTKSNNGKSNDILSFLVKREELPA
jgi:hypothetical protein